MFPVKISVSLGLCKYFELRPEDAVNIVDYGPKACPVWYQAVEKAE